MDQRNNIQASNIQPRKKPRLSWRTRLLLAFAAAAIILAFATSYLWKQDRRQGRQLEQMQAQIAQDAAAMRAYADVVGAPDTESITLQQQSGAAPGQAHVLFNARLGLAIYSGLISPAPSGKSYQLWLVPASGAPVSAGVVAANQQSGPLVAHFQQGVSASAFAVTLEPQGGSAQPSGSKVLVGSVNS